MCIIRFGNDRIQFPEGPVMKPTIRPAGLRIPGAATGAVPLLTGLLFFLTVPRLAGQGASLPELQTAQQVRQLTPEQAARHYPVRLRGVVTFYDQNQFFRFVQDDTAGIYFQLDNSPDLPPLAAGQLVEVEGEADPGEYAPVVMLHKIQILGQG